MRIYALIDPSLLEEATRNFASRTPSKPGSTVVSVVPSGVGLNDQNAMSVLPYLVSWEATVLRESSLQQTIEWALEFHAATWIASFAEAKHLADMLARRMQAELSEQQSILLRFCDARVLPVVHRVLDADQRAGFFAPVTQWWYFNREEILCQLPISPAHKDEEWLTPWQLDDDQEAGLLDAAAPDAVHAILRRYASADLEALPRCSRHAFLLRQIANARRWNIHAENQQALFCLVAMELGEGFDEVGDWPHALAEVKAGKRRLEEAIASVQQTAAA